VRFFKESKFEADNIVAICCIFPYSFENFTSFLAVFEMSVDEEIVFENSPLAKYLEGILIDSFHSLFSDSPRSPYSFSNSHSETHSLSESQRSITSLPELPVLQAEAQIHNSLWNNLVLSQDKSKRHPFLQYVQILLCSGLLSDIEKILLIDCVNTQINNTQFSGSF
jgi:hypothetical protein